LYSSNDALSDGTDRNGCNHVIDDQSTGHADMPTDRPDDGTALQPCTSSRFHFSRIDDINRLYTLQYPCYYRKLYHSIRGGSRRVTEGPVNQEGFGKHGRMANVVVRRWVSKNVATIPSTDQHHTRTWHPTILAGKRPLWHVTPEAVLCPPIGRPFHTSSTMMGHVHIRPDEFPSPFSRARFFERHSAYIIRACIDRMYCLKPCTLLLCKRLASGYGGECSIITTDTISVKASGE